MSRLYGIKVDENKWDAIKIDNVEDYPTFRIIKKGSFVNNAYYFKYVIGVEQVSEDEFLVFRRANYDDFEISRCKLQDGKLMQLFTKRFSQFYFITDDRILFTYWGNTGPYRCGGIYSIKDNKILEDGKWLEGDPISVITEGENQDAIKLYVEKEIDSDRFDDPKLIFTVDPSTLQPNSECYSELRDSYIKVSTKEDVKKIESEDVERIEEIECEMHDSKVEQLKKARERVLSRTEEKK